MAALHTVTLGCVHDRTGLLSIFSAAPRAYRVADANHLRDIPIDGWANLADVDKPMM